MDAREKRRHELEKFGRQEIERLYREATWDMSGRPAPTGILRSAMIEKILEKEFPKK